MSDTSLRWLTLLVAAALVALIALGSITGSGAVADDLRSRVELVLADGGLDGVQVDLVGREVTLSDGSHVDLAEAEQLVAAVTGVRSVQVDAPGRTARPSSAAPQGDDERAGAASLELRVMGGRIAISGRVPDADAAASIKSGAALAFGQMVAGDLTVAASTGPAAWVRALPDLLGDLVGVKGLQLSIGTDSTIRVGGTIESAAGRDKISRYVSSALPGLELSNRLTIDAGRLSQADASTVNRATVLFDVGSSIVTFAGAQPLGELAGVLSRKPRLRLQAIAHVGPPAERSLTRQRLAAVKAYLVAFGIEPDRITTRSHAAGAPTDVNPSAEQYRRVDFIVKES